MEITDGGEGDPRNHMPSQRQHAGWTAVHAAFARPAAPLQAAAGRHPTRLASGRTSQVAIFAKVAKNMDESKEASG